MNSHNCSKCGQFSNGNHSCRTFRQGPPKSAPKSLPQAPGKILSTSKMKQHEVLASARLMNTALGDPLEGGRSSFAQKQARIVLEQKFGKIDWSK